MESEGKIKVSPNTCDNHSHTLASQGDPLPGNIQHTRRGHHVLRCLATERTKNRINGVTITTKNN